MLPAACVVKAKKAPKVESDLGGLTVAPCELVENNGDGLLALVLEQAGRWGVPGAFIPWLKDENLWLNSLVDRIVVSAPEADREELGDPFAVLTEPFALWVIQRPAREPKVFPQHRAIAWVEDLEPYHLRKLRLLNAPHTAMVSKALPLAFETVREVLDDEALRAWLEALLREEILPHPERTLRRRGGVCGGDSSPLANPHFHHRLADIALNHDVKVRTRLLPIIEDYREIRTLARAAVRGRRSPAALTLNRLGP